MRRSADFGVTVKQGRRAVQPDIVLYDRRPEPAAEVDSQSSPPTVGLIIAKSVGSAVDRHRVARRLRHVARGVVDELVPAEQLVIRALPGSNHATSETLRAQVYGGLSSIRRSRDAAR